jgi:molecular chaperone DnaK
MGKPVLGIDFGTTNTSAAWVDESGQVRAVPLRDDGGVNMPTVVWYDGKGNVLAGQSAREMSLADPDNTIFGFKRFLGRRFASDFVHRQKERFPYKMVAGPEGDVAFEAHGRVRPIVETTFHVFSRVLELANVAAGEQFEECILTTPAHSGLRQRNALRQAAEMAGLEVKAILNEPTAAALFAQRTAGPAGPDPSELVLVFDLGGGTFDCTLLHSRRGLTEVLATSGDGFLGGNDFDGRIVDSIVERYLEKTGDDLRRDPVVMQRLSFAAENAKIRLSTEERAAVQLRCIAGTATGFVSIERMLTRPELESLVAPLIERCLGFCDEMLGKARKTRGDVSSLLFVGGQTRMPALRDRLTGIFRFDSARQPDPDLAVAAGAALFGKGLHVLTDVAPMSIGFMVPGGQTQELIASSSSVPCIRRVQLVRPAAGPLAVAFYEAVNFTSTEREVLGSVKIDEEWLASHPGRIYLDARMDREYELKLAVSTEDGESLPLKLLGPSGGR